MASVTQADASRDLDPTAPDVAAAIKQLGVDSVRLEERVKGRSTRVSTRPLALVRIKAAAITRSCI